MKLCAELASRLSISLASARRKVELAAAKDGVKDLKSRKSIAERLLNEDLIRSQSEDSSSSAQLDELGHLAVLMAAGPFIWPPGRSNDHQAVQMAVGPFRWPPGRSDGHRAVQMAAGPFRWPRGRSDGRQAVQMAARPFR